MTPDQIIFIAAIILAAGIPVGYWLNYRRSVAKAKDILATNIEAGLTEPVSLHPKIDCNSCISTGACVSACPEGKILGIVGGRGQLVSPSKCIGHGACMQACPTGAISLVFGTETRGVDIPHVKETFETNVDGIYIAGELGGMGLIRNAVTQGRQAVENIRSSSARDGVFDLVIVGAGPAGLSATLQAKKQKLKYITLEQESEPGGAILHYPRQKLVMTQPMEIPLYGKYKRREINKEELVELWNEVIDKTELEIATGHKVTEIKREGDHFTVETNKDRFTANNVILAIGRRGTPRKLQVPGEEGSRVCYRVLEPEQYEGMNLLVVGGGDSAVEGALALSEQHGTTVWLSYRKAVFSRIKEGNRTRLDEVSRNGKITLLLESQVTAIDEREVRLNSPKGEVRIPNDYVFAFLGGELPTVFLEKVGVKMQKMFGER